MKIIKPGRPPEPTCLRGECLCGCVFECEENEVDKKLWHDETSYVFPCPTCNALIYLMEIKGR